jgi:phenylacetate-CoA ligase
MEIAFSSPLVIAQLQEEKLRAHIHHCRENSPYYRAVLADIDIRPNKNIAEILAPLPFTDKQDIEQHNDKLCAVTPDRIVDISMSSGTTGQPTKIIYTDHDLQRLAYNEEKSFLGCGLSAGDTVLLTCTIDRCFIAGLAYFLGIRAIGAAAIRNGHGTMDSHAEIVGRLDPTAIVGVPTFVRKLGLHLRNAGMDPTQTAVSKIVCIGEPIRDRDLALTKIPDLAIVEIIDAEGNALPPGEVGEIVVTPFDVEGMPLIRFRTGDLSLLIDEPCSCGRNSSRLGPILGRKNQMLKVKGTTVYPQAVFAALSELDFVSDYYISVSSRDDLADQLTVHVAVKKGGTLRAIEEKLQSRLRIKPEISIEEERELRKSVYLPEFRKPMRFKDLRTP